MPYSIFQLIKFFHFSDEDELMLDCPEDEDMRDYTLQIWHEDFRPVAKQLLDRIDQYQSDLETLEHPS